jgi:hypothetical protein
MGLTHSKPQVTKMHYEKARGAIHKADWENEVEKACYRLDLILSVCPLFRSVKVPYPLMFQTF